MPLNTDDKTAGQVCLFAKTPVYGRVKTRLEPELGKDKCLSVHKWLVEDRLNMLSEVGPDGYDLALYVTDDPQDPYWQNISVQYPISIYLQVGSSLGERMYKAVEDTLKHKDWVILIGADCPDLDVGYLNSAVSELEVGHRVVIGPAEDGGYVLMAVKEPMAELFEGIDWGTDRVLEQTKGILERQNIPYSQLQPLKDLDVWDDYVFYSGKINTLPE